MPSIPFVAWGAPALCLVLSACSTTANLDHVTMCEQLSASLLGEPDGIDWISVEKRPMERAELEIELRFEVPGRGAQTAVCYHEWRLNEQDAELYSDPLAGFSKAPYKMTLNDRPVADRDLAAATHAIMRRAGQEFAEAADRAIQTGAAKLQETVTR